MLVLAGDTDVTTYFKLRLSATSLEATGLTPTDFDLQFVRSGVVPSAKVDATALASVGAAHSDNTVIEVDVTDQPGLYRVDWPDPAFASGVREVILTVKVATIFTEELRVELSVPVGAVLLQGVTHTGAVIPDVTLVATTTTVTGGALDVTVAKDATVSKEATLTARTLLAASYFDPATDAVANVTLVATTTTNTDMRGSDSVDVDASLVAIHLDHLLAVDYDPATPPGVATALLNELVQDDGVGISQFTTKALELAPAAGGGFVSASYRWSTDITATDPTSGRVKGNNATLASITAVYISTLASGGGNATVFIEALSVGDQLAVAVEGSGGNFFLLTIDAAPTDNTGWFTITGVVSDSGGTIGNNNTVTVTFAYTAASVAAIADGVWDELLTGATHGIAQSAGKRLLDIAGLILDEGTLQSATADTAVLAATASAVDDFFTHARLAIVDGTGTGQSSRVIAAYVGSSRTATISPAWTVTPDATSDYIVTPASVHTSTKNGGYENAAIYVDTIGGVAGTLPYVNGTSTRPSLTLADARTLANGFSLRRFDIRSGSSIALAQAFDQMQFLGAIYTVALGGQSVDGTQFRQAIVSGADDGLATLGTLYEECQILSVTLGEHLLERCQVIGPILLGGTGSVDYTWTDCYSAADPTPTVVDFQAAAVTRNLNLGHFNGQLEVRNFNAGGGTHTMKVTGSGELILAVSCAGGSIVVAGSIVVTDNAGGAVTLLDEARYEVQQVANAMRRTPTGTVETDSVDEKLGTLLARITATLFANITSLAQWLGLITGKQVGNATARTELRATGSASGTYDEVFDSLEAQRDEFVGFTVNGRMKSDLTALNGFAPDAVKLQEAASTNTLGTVDNAAFTPTSTEFEASNITDPTGHFDDLVIKWQSGALAGLGTDITAYTLVGGRGHFLVTDMGQVPSTTDKFVIL